MYNKILELHNTTQLQYIGITQYSTATIHWNYTIQHSYNTLELHNTTQLQYIGITQYNTATIHWNYTIQHSYNTYRMHTSIYIGEINTPYLV